MRSRPGQGLTSVLVSVSVSVSVSISVSASPSVSASVSASPSASASVSACPSVSASVSGVPVSVCIGIRCRCRCRHPCQYPHPYLYRYHPRQRRCPLGLSGFFIVTTPIALYHTHRPCQNQAPYASSLFSFPVQSIRAATGSRPPAQTPRSMSSCRYPRGLIFAIEWVVSQVHVISTCLRRCWPQSGDVDESGCRSDRAPTGWSNRSRALTSTIWLFAR